MPALSGAADENTDGATTAAIPAVDVDAQGEPEHLSASNADEPLQTLPEGWTEETTDAGEVYFFNSDTGETQWERPLATRDTAAVEESPIEGSHSADELTHVQKDPEVSEDSAPPAINTADDGQLLAPWETLYTPEGEAYYFNPESGETSWEKPSVPSASSASADYRTSATSAAAVAAASASAAPLRPRPAHAIASFGFGGKLSVMFPQQATSLMGGPAPAGTVGLRRGPVVVHTLRNILDASDAALSTSESSYNDRFQPMITMDEAEAYSRIEEKASQENGSLLWNLILIAAKWNGRLRSINGPSDKNSPESAIIQLLLDSNNALTNGKDQRSAYAMPSPMKIGTAMSQRPGQGIRTTRPECGRP